jgi:predicted transcriptional regulator
MPKRISAEIDMQILADVGLGMLNKDVAVKYGVSASYISKVSLGKKVPDIHISKPTTMVDQSIDVNHATIQDIETIIRDNPVLASKEEVEKFLKNKIEKSIVHAKLYIDLLKMFKGGK